ncbi:MAG: 1-hydroxycarotenoid 3,4-desaturase CrtD [Pseudomonadota bacterium]
MGSGPRVAVIGAGIGGLSAAAILARRFDVDVYERAPQAGGKVRQIDIGGAKIDSGPTVFTMDWAFEEVMELAGAELTEEVTLNKLDVLARHFWTDGSTLDLFADREKSAAAIAEFAGPRDAANYRAFCSKTRDVYETLREPFLRSQKPSFAGLIASQSPLSLLNTSPFSTLWGALSRSFEDPRLRQLFGRYATYCGASPFRAPATLMLIAHVEQEGVWALDGGMQSIAKALERVATRNGVTFHYDSDVTEIVEAAGRVQGVRINGGDVRPADILVMNGDAAAIAAGALGAAGPRALSLPGDIQRSQSAMTWSMVAEPKGVPLDMHTVFFSDDYAAEFDAVFDRGEVPAHPTTYICAPDRAPGLRAPSGAERLFCLINAPPKGDTHTFTDKETAQCQERMLTLLQHCGLNLEAGLESAVATTPSDFNAMFPATGGALYGMASHGWRASFQRPAARTRLQGLYLAGGSVHPGPGAPMAALSGKAAALAILSDCGLTLPSPLAAMPGGTSMR